MKRNKISVLKQNIKIGENFELIDKLYDQEIFEMVTYKIKLSHDRDFFNLNKNTDIRISRKNYRVSRTSCDMIDSFVSKCLVFIIAFLNVNRAYYLANCIDNLNFYGSLHQVHLISSCGVRKK